MRALCQLVLAVICATPASPTLDLNYRSGATWRLEMNQAPTPMTRTRRQAGGMPCLTVTFLTEMKGRFADRIDTNDDGKATLVEIHEYLSYFNPSVSDRQVSYFIKRRDRNGNGRLEFVPEYILDIATPDMTPEAAKEWFELEDINGNGYVSRKELMHIAQRLGINESQADISVSSYYMTVDVDGDDRLSFDEFKVLYGQ